MFYDEIQYKGYRVRGWTVTEPSPPWKGVSCDQRHRKQVEWSGCRND